MCITDVTAGSVERAFINGSNYGYIYGFESALLKAHALIFAELPYPQAKALADKLMALKPESKHINGEQNGN